MRYATAPTGRRYRADRPARVGDCARCGRRKALHTATECGSCYHNSREDWARAAPGGAGVPCTTADVDARRAQYGRLRSSAFEIRQAARHMRISERTARRHEAALIAAGWVRRGAGLYPPRPRATTKAV